jgi:hypothetical protein
MANAPIALRSNAGPFNFLGVTKLLNMYAVKLDADAKAPYAAVSCPGTLTFSEVTDTPCRGRIFMEDLDALYTVHSSSIWKIDSAGNATRIGTIPGIDRVQIARNQKVTPQIVVQCAAGLYLVENDEVSILLEDDLPDEDCISVAGIGGYIVYGFEDGRYFISSLNEATLIDALDFATAEQAADKLVRLWALGGELLVLGTQTIEPWVNSGSADFPFELRSASSVVKKGCLSTDSVVEIDNTVFWIGDDRKHYRLNGYNAQKTSNEEVDRLINDDPNQGSISSTAYSFDGHDFVILTGTDWTMELDVGSGYWHRRESYQSTRWRHDHAVSAWDKVLVGDRDTGSIYYFDRDTHTEAGATMIRGMDLPPLSAFPNGGIIDALHFDVATGQGLTSPSAQGYDPAMMVLLSKDGGNTFATERQLQTGRSGAYRRVNSRRWGKFGPNGCVVRIRMSDPVGFAVALVDHKTRPLRIS